MITFWESHLDATTYVSWFPTVFTTTTSITVTYQPVAYWEFMPEMGITWWRNGYETFTVGAFKSILADSEAVTAVAPIILERATGRFIFGRVFSRVN